MMMTLYSICHLVHADLSEYNILWWQKEAWFIDVSQAVEPIHPSGLDFLLRDCTNIYNFFSKKGLQVLEPYQLFSQVSGLEVKDGSEADILAQIRRYQKNQSLKSVHGVTNMEEAEDNFDYCWEHSLEQSKSTTPAKPIPGHSETKRAAKSPRSPKSPGFVGPGLSKSPGGKSPKSPGSDFVGLTDDELRKLKISLLDSNSDVEQIEPRKPSTIKFSDCSDFKTVNPDQD